MLDWQIMTKTLLAILVVLVFVLWICVLAYFRRNQEVVSGKKTIIGIFTFGPFWPLINKHMSQKNWELSKREIFGWIVVFILMMVGIIVAK